MGLKINTATRLRLVEARWSEVVRLILLCRIGPSANDRDRLWGWPPV